MMQRSMGAVVAVVYGLAVTSLICGFVTSQKHDAVEVTLSEASEGFGSPLLISTTTTPEYEIVVGRMGSEIGGISWTFSVSGAIYRNDQRVVSLVFEDGSTLTGSKMFEEIAPQLRYFGVLQ